MDAAENGELPGVWLRQQREAAGLTQEELAQLSGISVKTIANLERGRTRRPYPSSLRSLVRALHLPERSGTELVAQYRLGAYSAPSQGIPSAMSQATVVPHQLPAPTGPLVGRIAQLAVLDQLLVKAIKGRGPTMVISAIVGTAGIGKTALALHWAHRAAGRFPDGQLYLNLRGFDSSGEPVAPADAIRALLDALQAPREHIPAGFDAKIGLYRSMMAGRRLLVVLDNVLDAEHVRPLLPGSAGCLVIVTSRSQMSGLAAMEGAHLIKLDALTDAEARELLTMRLGTARVAAEPDAVEALLKACSRLPLALAIASVRAIACPSLPLATLAADLQDASKRLNVLDAGDSAADVRAVFSWSYRHLGHLEARMFRLLGLHPGPDFTAPAAASLTGVPSSQAYRALRELTCASLISEHIVGRYTVNDLLRAYANEQAELLDNAEDRRTALHRMFDHYLHTSGAVGATLYGHRSGVTLGSPQPATSPEVVTAQEHALAWLDAEHEVLLNIIDRAAATGFETHSRQLSRVLRWGSRFDGQG